jgi:cobalt/nickel transport system permease protein
MRRIYGRYQKCDTRNIFSLEQLAGGHSVIHRRHPLVKLVSAFVYIITVVSFGRTELVRLIPFVFYPVLLMALSETPWRPVLKRAAIAVPFVLFAGVSNILFDRTIAFTLGGVGVSFGVLSFFSLLYRTLLCVAAVLILAAVTPFDQLAAQLRRLRVPGIFVTLFEMTYRYIGVLLEETSSMNTAYMLRSTEHKGLQMKHMGSFVGQLLIRSFDRAERIYSAMKCRGYASADRIKRRQALTKQDFLYLAAACLPFLLLRVLDVSAVFNNLFGTPA